MVLLSLISNTNIYKFNNSFTVRVTVVFVVES